MTIVDEVKELHGLTEDELDVMTSILLNQLTVGDVLQPSADTLYLPGSHVIVQVSLRDDDYSKTKWFDIFVGWTDLEKNLEAVVSSMHLYRKGIADIVALDYWVDLRFIGKRSWAVTGDHVSSGDVYDSVVGKVQQEFRKPVVKAMQLLEQIEAGLKRKFES